ncbi:MAG: transglutaminase family protein [Phycisphaerales bacterium JB058]
MKHAPASFGRLLAGILLLALSLPAMGQQGESSERYYIVQLGGQRAGWMRESSRTTDETLTHDVELHFEIKRGETGVKISMESQFVETLDHKPISMSSTQTMAANPVTTRVKFLDDALEVTVEQSGNSSTQTQPRPEGEWLTPGGAEEYFRRRREAGAEKITMRVIDPMAGARPIVTTYEDFREESIEVFGREVQALRATLTTSEMAGIKTTEYIDGKGRMLKSTTNLGGLEMTVLAADKELALSELDAPELMQSTFVQPKGRIASPRKTERAVYLLSVPDDKLDDLPEVPSQKQTRVNERTIRLEVTMGEDAPEQAEPGPEYTEASSMIDIKDPVVIELAKKAHPNQDAPPAVAAEAMRRFVFEHIDEKNLGVGMGSASEVARTCTGDCTEHATLLAALLRVHGIPSRVVSGLVYVNNFEGAEEIFGYHMWTQAWVNLDGNWQWVDYDATLGPYGRFDATHIALSVSAMQDNETNNSMIALVPLLGRLQIEIESTD